MSLNIRIIAPDGLIWDTNTEGVVLPSLTGQLGILPGHAPLITSLEIGILRIKANSKWTPIIVLGGFAVIQNDIILVLISGVEEVIEGDYEKAKKKLAEAKKKLEKEKKKLDSATTTKKLIDAAQELKIASAKVKAYHFI